MSHRFQVQYEFTRGSTVLKCGTGIITVPKSVVQSNEKWTGHRTDWRGFDTKAYYVQGHHVTRKLFRTIRGLSSKESASITSCAIIRMETPEKLELRVERSQATSRPY
jgi:hypothetical protein